MNKTIELGCINQLKIHRISEPGLYLIAQNEEEVLLPNSYITSKMQIGDMIEVFIYTDSEDRLVATTQKPFGMLYDFIAAEVVDNVKFGSFVDWGLPKDLLVPKNKQRSTFNLGAIKVIQIINDEKTNRLIGTEKFQLSKAQTDTFTRNDAVEILVYTKTPLGFKVIVNNEFDGLVFHNEIFEKINLGDKKRAYIKLVRDDGKLDVSLQIIGEKKEENSMQKVVDILNQNGGEMSFTYKSDVEEIKAVFGMSKKSFKASLTKLLENQSIVLGETSIKLNPK